MFDWQTVVVILIVAAALLYTARRAFARLRAFTPGSGDGGAASCASGCGKCGDDGERPAKTGDVLVRISSSRTTPDRRAH